MKGMIEGSGLQEMKGNIDNIERKVGAIKGETSKAMDSLDTRMKALEHFKEVEIEKTYELKKTQGALAWGHSRSLPASGAGPPKEFDFKTACSLEISGFPLGARGKDIADWIKNATDAKAHPYKDVYAKGNRATNW
eukprot:2843400-Heterocapsa_arctica.AAC.1